MWNLIKAQKNKQKRKKTKRKPKFPQYHHHFPAFSFSRSLFFQDFFDFVKILKKTSQNQSPYNIILIYQHAIDFVRDVQKYFFERKSKKKTSSTRDRDREKDRAGENERTNEPILISFLNESILQSLIYKVHKDYSDNKIQDLLTDKDSFNPKESNNMKKGTKYDGRVEFRPLLHVFPFFFFSHNKQQNFSHTNFP